jgi:hypothetical protein
VRVGGWRRDPQQAGSPLSTSISAGFRNTLQQPTTQRQCGTRTLQHRRHRHDACVCVWTAKTRWKRVHDWEARLAKKKEPPACTWKDTLMHKLPPIAARTPTSLSLAACSSAESSTIFEHYPSCLRRRGALSSHQPSVAFSAACPVTRSRAPSPDS